MDYVVREMKNKNFNGVNRIDRLMQRQYLGEKWDTMDEDVKKKHLVSSAHNLKFFWVMAIVLWQ